MVRPATRADVPRLRTIDDATRSSTSTPNPDGEHAPDRFDDDLSDVLVAEVDGVVAGMVRLGRPTRLASNRHVWSVVGLDVHPAVRRRGVGRALLDAAADEATRRGGTRLTLRVLAPNTAARALYAAAGFAEEGVLRGEFVLDGRPVDDVLMARSLAGDGRARQE